MRRATVAAALLALGSVLPIAEPAFAQYGAIAWDKETGKRGWSWNQATLQRAVAVALSACGASGCKVIIKVGPGRCGALATTENGKTIGASSRASDDEARVAAIANCQKDARPFVEDLARLGPIRPGEPTAEMSKLGECVVRIAECNK
jgi:Domain of unknown function (DUF4189)